MTSQGLKGFYSLTQPITDNYITSTLGETKAWPFPQIFYGNESSFLCFSDAIYELDGSYVATLLDTKDAADPTGSTAKAITAGKDWHFVDMSGTWMFFNGSSVVYKTGRSSTVWVQDAVTINTGCVHKEARIVLGGFGNFYATVDWADYWRTLAGDMPDEYDGLADVAPGGNWVWWSSFMAPDMLSMFLQDMLLYASAETSPTTGFTTDRPYIMELMERNESGMRPVPMQGSVRGLVPLGDGIVVYGNDGIRYMASFNANQIHTYGMHNIRGLGERIGVLNGSVTRTTFAGGKDRHIFLDKSLELWQVLPDLTASRLGYREHFSGLDTSKVLINHDPLYDEFYISDGTLSFVLNKDGLCRNPSMPTKLTSLSGTNLTAIKFDTASPTAMDIESGTITSPSGGVEVLTAANIVGLNSSSNGMVLKVKSRCKQTEDFYESASISLDGRTRALMDIPYTQYRWSLTATTASGVTVEDVEFESSTDVNPGLDAKIAASVPSAASE